MGASKKKRPPPPPPAPPPPLAEWIRKGLADADALDALGDGGGVGPAPGAELPRRERLRGRFRIEALFSTGRVGQTRLIAVRAMPSPFARVRAAFLVGKAFGKAVARGRLRRRLRALYREGKHALPLPAREPSSATSAVEASARPVPSPEASANDGGAAGTDGGKALAHRGWDLAIIPRRGAAEADTETLRRELALALRRALAEAQACASPSGSAG